MLSYLTLPADKPLLVIRFTLGLRYQLTLVLSGIAALQM